MQSNLLKGMQAPYHALGSFLHNNVKDPVHLVGRGVRWLTDMNEGGKFVAAGAFGAVCLKGLKDTFNIILDSHKWISVEDRFKSKREVKPIFVNTTPAAQIEAARIANDNAKAIEVEKNGSFQTAQDEVAVTQGLYNALNLGADPIVAKAALEAIIIDYEKYIQEYNALQVFVQNYLPADLPGKQANLEALQLRLPPLQAELQEYQQYIATLQPDDPGQNHLQNQIAELKIRIAALEENINQHAENLTNCLAKEESVREIAARRPEINNFAADQVQPLLDQSHAGLLIIEDLTLQNKNKDTAQTELTEAAEVAKEKKEAFEKLISPKPQPPKNPIDGHYIVELRESVTSKSTAETHIPLPFSNHALVIYHAAMIKAFATSFMGIGETVVGSLGLINTLTADNCSPENFTCLDSVVFDPQLVAVAKLIGAPVRGVIQGAGYVASQFLEPQSNAYIVGNIGMTALLSVAALKSFNSIEGKFINWKAVPFISQPNGQPFINRGMFVRDTIKFTLGVASLLTAGTIVDNMLTENVG